MALASVEENEVVKKRKRNLKGYIFIAIRSKILKRKRKENDKSCEKLEKLTSREKNQQLEYLEMLKR